uniref:Uncharacterized protein n=1 Tax=Arundo donax TaxID=35708 RepID=A0A0A9HLR8_ARUDO
MNLSHGPVECKLPLIQQEVSSIFMNTLFQCMFIGISSLQIS